MVHLCRRVEFDTEVPLHEPRSRLFELQRTVVRVAVSGRFVDLLSQHASDSFVGHGVVIAYAEVEQLALRVIGKRLPLGPFDFLELVDGGTFTIVGTSNTFGKLRLEIGVGHAR